jgi:hypothetical protein
MIVCKKCFESNFNKWIEPFKPDVKNPDIIPPFNEEVQHYQVYSVEEIASRLQNGEMIEIICNLCKRTHVGKDNNGVIKIRYVNKNWENYIA